MMIIKIVEVTRVVQLHSSPNFYSFYAIKGHMNVASADVFAQFDIAALIHKKDRNGSKMQVLVPLIHFHHMFEQQGQMFPVTWRAKKTNRMIMTGEYYELETI